MQISIYQRMANNATPKLYVDKGDTAQNVVDKNPTRGWTSLPTNLEYTAQLILASSYGLMQQLYDTARWNGFEDSSSPARSVEDLLIPSENIRVAVRSLQYYYSLTNPTWSKEQKIKNVLGTYNGSGPTSSYTREVWNTYQSTLYDKN